MPDLLSLEEYQALADTILFPSNAFIDGRFQPAQSGKRFNSINPATGKILTKVAACNETDVNLAVEKARDAFEKGIWSKKHPSERKSILIRLAKLIKRNQHELAVMESLDSGKPIRDCISIDVQETIHTIIWHAEATDKLYDQTAPANDDAVAMIVREPIGVVGCVLPWNFPLLMLAWKIAPALATGNSVIVKPAEQTSLTALRIAELAMEAGIPAGVFNVITGMGTDVGQPLGLHPDVDMITFTGSTETGRHFLRYSADSNLKKIVLECGGKNPAIVLEDAEDLDLVAQHIVTAAFWNMGENCSAASRLIVHKSVKSKLIKHIQIHLKEWRTGNPLDPKNHLGALIDKTHFDKVCSYLDPSYLSEKQVLAGGVAQTGFYVLPTLLDDIPPEHKLAKEEIFGPILSIITVSSTEEALAIANDSQYGLTASIFSANGKQALRAARAIRAGTVTINCYGEGDISTPFGGYKQSGFGGRDNALQAHDQYTELKTIWIDLSDRAAEEAID